MTSRRRSIADTTSLTPANAIPEEPQTTQSGNRPAQRAKQNPCRYRAMARLNRLCDLLELAEDLAEELAELPEEDYIGKDGSDHSAALDCIEEALVLVRLACAGVDSVAIRTRSARSMVRLMARVRDAEQSSE